MKRLFYAIVIIVVAITSFITGRYKIEIYEGTPYFWSYKTMWEAELEMAVITTDMLEDIYENDNDYFTNRIIPTKNYNKLIEHYKKWENDTAVWDWESMYNL